MQHYKQLNQHGLTTGKSCREHRYMTRLWLSALVRVCAGIICRYMAIPCQPRRGWIQLPVLFIDGYTSAAASTIAFPGPDTDLWLWAEPWFRQQRGGAGSKSRIQHMVDIQSGKNWRAWHTYLCYCFWCGSIPFSSRKAALLPVKRMTCCCYRETERALADKSFRRWFSCTWLGSHPESVWPT